MTGNPRENVKNKGFWDGGAGGRGKNSESAGHTSSFPGMRKPGRVGIRTDIDFPDTAPVKGDADRV